VTPVELGSAVDEGARFTEWYGRLEPQLRRGLCATYGPERGREATAEALAWAWEHRDRVDSLDRPLPYLYRVERSRTRLRRFRIPPMHTEWSRPCRTTLNEGSTGFDLSRGELQ
jgi:DNA-directed RNA polymerase specialized sigma24 family protein